MHDIVITPCATFYVNMAWYCFSCRLREASMPEEDLIINAVCNFLREYGMVLFFLSFERSKHARRRFDYYGILSG